MKTQCRVPEGETAVTWEGLFAVFLTLVLIGAVLFTIWLGVSLFADNVYQDGIRDGKQAQIKIDGPISHSNGHNLGCDYLRPTGSPQKQVIGCPEVTGVVPNAGWPLYTVEQHKFVENDDAKVVPFERK